MKWFTVSVLQSDPDGTVEEYWSIGRGKNGSLEQIELYEDGQLFTYRSEAEEIAKYLNDQEENHD